MHTSYALAPFIHACTCGAPVAIGAVAIELETFPRDFRTPRSAQVVRDENLNREEDEGRDAQ